MPRDTLTGSRIRERRIMRGVKQADLARKAGISASYLNLIEHNRRRIGGKLLLDIAGILEVEPTVLSEGAEATLIATLREAASDVPQAGAEMDRVEEFAGRFPGWAQLLADGRTRIAALERTVETLTDRMTHDPHLAASLHEMLSTVTAIHSAAAILAEPGDVDPEWQARFHRNIHEDSERLADTSRALVTYLEADSEAATELGVPQEELDATLEAAGHQVPELEQGGTVDAAAARLGQGLSTAARALLVTWLQRYASDAAALPIARLQAPLDDLGPDPARLAQALAADPAQVMRRLAALPPQVLPDPVGLAICDASGVLSYRKPLPDFPMPRFGAACPLWPLYRALNRPWVILSLPVVQPGRHETVYQAQALASPVGAHAVNADPLFEAHMLIRPLPGRPEGAAPLPVGTACRICPRAGCPGRREPSVLAEV
ncbi:helix-turn-helix transcriptional regulator [Tropicibacter oceani]|uniref:Short-chain fatty acyl-CoA regulator family protein n=1 Tax=Tropicibacter oceani TaxID=3058420 RepID=A0ABY8QPB4_9RHOB|nr:helix-turn-helix transcriptional regulator [Tropicibacter oceani]WGW05886.1 short-chain fatty acyl-CoA regulator family protein [Tropicibacter oceani]